MKLTILLSFIAIMLTILNTIFVVSKSHIDKNICGFNEIILFTSLLISIIWCIYGYIEKNLSVFIGYLIIIILLIYLFILYYKYNIR
jgi:hypothetical protein